MSDVFVSSEEATESIPTEIAEGGIYTKYCPGCEQTLPLTTEHFYRSKINKDGWYGKCKKCCSEQKKTSSKYWKSEEIEDSTYLTQPISSDEVTEPVITEITDGKYCPGCKRTLPLTTEYYYYHNHSGRRPSRWERLCKVCRRAQEKERKWRQKTASESINKVESVITEPVITEITDGKYCPGCKRTLPLTTEYYVYINGGWHRKCRVCEHIVISDGIRRKKVEKARGTSDQCGSCGTDKGNILGDINDATHERYGYLCSRCYRMMLECQKDAPRMRKVLTYIELTR